MGTRGHLAAALLFTASCIVPAPSSEKDSPESSRAAAVSNVPPLALKSGANFENKVEVVGAAVVPGKVLPGEQAKVTVYFKVLEEIAGDYMVFVHVEDPEGRMERLNIDHRPVGGTYPTSQWKKGETVKDEFGLYVPATDGLHALNIWMGFWQPADDSRLKLTNPDAVRNDGNNRILLVTVPVST